MEPANVVPMDFNEKEESEHSTQLQDEVNPNIYSAIHELKEGIYKFKGQLFYSIVSNDSNHKASSLGAMYSFHALFLQCIAYWIGMMDSTSIPKPKFSNDEETKEFNALSKAIQTVSKDSTDAHILTYNLLFKFSTAHPFDLGKQKQDD